MAPLFRTALGAFVLSTTYVQAREDPAPVKENPIRKVVNLLQAMAEAVNKEIDKEAQMNKKMACFCEKSENQLTAEQAAAADAIARHTQAHEAAAARRDELETGAKADQASRKDAADRLAKSKAKRLEDKAAYDKLVGEEKETIASVQEAIKVLSKAMGIDTESVAAADRAKREKDEADQARVDAAKGNLAGAERTAAGVTEGFLQARTKTGVEYVKKVLKKLVDGNGDGFGSQLLSKMDLSSQQSVLSFVSTSNYAGQSGQIIGILKQLLEEMDIDLNGAISAEEDSVKAYKDSVAALESMIKQYTASVETKLVEKGEKAVEATDNIAAKNAAQKTLGASGEALVATKAMCDNNVKDFQDRFASMSQELTQIHAAIEILNSDESLETFKKTDTRGKKYLFLQEKKSTWLSLLQKPSTLRQADQELTEIVNNKRNPQLALLAFNARESLRDKAAQKTTAPMDFSHVVEMIDNMVDALHKEHKTDAEQRDNCNTDLAQNNVDLVQANNAIAVLDSTNTQLSSEKAESEDEFAKFSGNIADAEKSVQAAGEQRMAETAAFEENVALNNQASELLHRANDKLLAFYDAGRVRKFSNVDSTKEAAARELGLVQIRSHVQQAPERFEGGPTTQASNGNKAVALLDKIIKDTEKDTTFLTTQEKNRQAAYVELVDRMNSQIDAATESKNTAEGVISEKAVGLQQNSDDTKSKKDEEQNLQKVKGNLDGTCNFILNYFHARGEMRDKEIEGLGKAKAILSGASFAPPAEEEAAEGA